MYLEIQLINGKNILIRDNFTINGQTMDISSSIQYFNNLLNNKILDEAITIVQEYAQNKKNMIYIIRKSSICGIEASESN